MGGVNPEPLVPFREEEEKKEEIRRGFCYLLA